MAGQRSPESEAREARRKAEEYLQQPGVQEPVAWALLAVAAELQAIRSLLAKQARR